MIGQWIDKFVSTLAPRYGVKRAQAREILRAYAGAESNRLNSQRPAKNQPADNELQGPWGADSVRALARQLVRDNAWAWSALESIVSETIGTGIGIQSMLEDESGQDEADTNENRDRIWSEWCESCELNGQMTFDEIQTLAFREMVEAGECLIHLVTVPQQFNGITRTVPLALELIEADRLATEYDTYQFAHKSGQNRVVRGVELDQFGKPVAYYIYENHPQAVHTYRREPVRIEAANIIHLYRRDRIGQTRGVSWYAPVIGWLRDLGVYTDNELQASAVASCYVGVIQSERPLTGLNGGTDADSSDANGNQYEYMEPGQILNLRPGETWNSSTPGRPNSSAEPWISMMLRGIAAGTGTSYESVSKDFSNTSYSSSRTSKLENRPRYRRWQKYWMQTLCQRVWDRFCEAAAIAGIDAFPTMMELLTDRRKVAPVEFMAPRWEWVDLNAEQQSSESAINALQTTYADEIGKTGGNWRRVFKQRAREEAMKRELNLVTPGDAQSAITAGTVSQQAENMAQQQAEATAEPTSELANSSTLQFKRNRKAIEAILNELANGETTEAKARVYLGSIGMRQESIDALIADALDGSVDELPPEPVEQKREYQRDKNGVRIL